MKRYSCPTGRMPEQSHAAPDRTAYRITGHFGETATFQIWPNRAAMFRTVTLQRDSRDAWRPVVPRQPGEARPYGE